MLRSLVILTLSTITLAPMAAAQQTESPIVSLYRQRVAVSTARIQQAKAVAEYEDARYRRVQYLYQRNAASREELEEARSKSIVASQEVFVKEAVKREDDALLLIAIERDQAGLQMPICSVNNGN